jgi:hypothetical protein
LRTQYKVSSADGTQEKKKKKVAGAGKINRKGKKKEGL